MSPKWQERPRLVHKFDRAAAPERLPDTMSIRVGVQILRTVQPDAGTCTMA